MQMGLSLLSKQELQKHKPNLVLLVGLQKI